MNREAEARVTIEGNRPSRERSHHRSAAARPGRRPARGAARPGIAASAAEGAGEVPEVAEAQDEAGQQAEHDRAGGA